MKFTREDYEKFIQLVRSNPCLYDTSLPEHKDAHLKHSIWTKITKDMNDSTMTCDDWKKVWKQKRDSFVRKRRMLLSCPSALAAKIIKRVPFYDQMSFLIGHLSGSSVNYLEVDDWQQCLTQEDDLQQCPRLLDDSEKCTSDELDEGTSSIDNDSKDNVALALSVSAVAVPSRSGTFDTASVSAETESSHSRSPTPEDISRSFPPNQLPGPHKKTKGYNARKREYTKITSGHLMGQINQCSQTDIESIQNTFSKFLQKDTNDDPEGNVFIFLAKRMKTLKKSTQQWMEDEALKLYLEAKKRDRVVKVEDL